MGRLIKHSMKIPSWVPLFMEETEGLTVVLEYSDGNLQTVSTRGDGERGEDITEKSIKLSDLITAINYSDHTVIIGQITCDDTDRCDILEKLKNSEDFSDFHFYVWDAHNEPLRETKEIFDWPPWEMTRREYLFNLEKQGFSVIA